MKKVKMYKIINLSVVADLIDKKNKIIKTNPVYGAISLAPNWRSLFMWYMALSKGYFSIPYGAENIYIAEVVVNEDERVLFAKNALNLNSTSWRKIPAKEAANASINGWVGGCTNFYGINPEVRVERDLEISNLWKINARKMDELEMIRPERRDDENYYNILGNELQVPEIVEFIEKIDSLKSGLVKVSRIEKAIADVKKLSKYRYPTKIPAMDIISVSFGSTAGEIVGALMLSKYKKIKIEEIGDNKVSYEDFYEWPQHENYHYSMRVDEFYTSMYDDSIEFDISVKWVMRVIDYLNNNKVSVIELLNKFKSPITVLNYLSNHI